MSRCVLAVVGNGFLAVLTLGLWAADTQAMGRRPQPPREGPVVARVQATPDTTRIGGEVRFLFEVRTAAEVKVAFGPRPRNDSLWSWRSWELGRTKTTSQGVYHTIEAVAQPFRTGDLVIPAPRYTVTPAGGQATGGRFPILTLRVESVLPGDEAVPDIRGLKPLLTTPWWMRFPWWLVVVAAALAGVAVWLWRRRPTGVSRIAPRSVPLAAAIPAHVEAIEALNALVAENLPQKGLWYPHQSRLSQILRRFLERRFSTSHTGLTTRELCLHLAWRGLPGITVDRVRSLLRIADLAKFARSDPGVERSRQLEEDARSVILEWAETRPETAPGPPAAVAPETAEGRVS